ncbi:hypothetical protein FAIPA1_370005 [Frankia sp. AiPs1]
MSTRTDHDSTISLPVIHNPALSGSAACGLAAVSGLALLRLAHRGRSGPRAGSAGVAGAPSCLFPSPSWAC